MQEKKLRHLLESLTLEEKVYQMVQLSGAYFDGDDTVIGNEDQLNISSKTSALAGSVLNVSGAEQVKRIQEIYLKNSRHKIPLLFMADIVYGYRTIFPIPLALGCSWNPELVREAYSAAAEEAYPGGAHVTFSPMADLVRDPRWGRCMESTGEDSFLNSCFAGAMVEGLQNQHNPKGYLAACVKHFAAYGAAEGGRDYNTVDMSRRRLRQEYLPAYKAAVDAGCKMVMTSFNVVDGIPATANEWLMKEVLRREWGFDGVVISDYAAVSELTEHGVAEDEAEAAALAVRAAVDIDMQSPCYANHLIQLAETGKISVTEIDEAVWRILKLKNSLGLFENPYFGADLEEEQNQSGISERRNLARKTAGESIVLLKNRDRVLPLGETVKIALIGPYADCKDILGFWAIYGRQEESVTLKEALEETLGTEQVIYSKGCEIIEDQDLIEQFGSVAEKQAWNLSSMAIREQKAEDAILAAKQSDVIILAIGEHGKQSGEAGSRTNLRLPTHQIELFRRLKKLGKPVIVVLFNGRPLVLEEIEQDADAILEAWFPGTEGGHALCDILTGNVNPSARLSMSFPKNEGQIPVYYNHLRTGRPVKDRTNENRFLSKYQDCTNEPLYGFGYGLSYHHCIYENLFLDKNILCGDEYITAKVTVTNLSKRDGDETVQLYIQDVSASVARPVKELKGFQKIRIRAGESREVEFQITESMLRFYNKDMLYTSEPGRFRVFIGKQADEVLETEFLLLSEK